MRVRYAAVVPVSAIAMTTGLSISAPGLARATGAVWQGVTAEAVDDYNDCNGPSLTNPITDVTGFLNTIYGGSNTAGFAPATFFQNTAVWPTDFFDPDVSGDPNDDDTNNFDQTNTSIAYFDGHGTCGGSGYTTTYCTDGSQCTSPPSGASAPGVCQRYPGDNWGYCLYLDNARTIVTDTCGFSDHEDGRAYFGWHMAWGENAYSGSWRGAATNGSGGLAVVSASCAEIAGMPNGVFPLFGGIKIIATTAVLSGDYASASDRGTAFAALYNANPSGSVESAWGDAMNSISNRNNWCENREGTQSYGGGFGYNGCGMQISTSMGATSAEASDALNQNWYALTNAYYYTGYGNSWFSNSWTCNYDCNTWGSTI